MIGLLVSSSRLASPQYGEPRRLAPERSRLLVLLVGDLPLRLTMIVILAQKKLSTGSWKAAMLFSGLPRVASV